MKTYRHSALIILISSLSLVIFSFSLLATPHIHAGGAHPTLPAGSSLKPDGETPVQLLAESVTITVRAATEADNALVELNPRSYLLDINPIWYEAVAEFEAELQLKNPTNQIVEVSAWFPLALALENVDWKLRPKEILPRIAQLQVNLGGKPVEYAVSEQPNPKGADSPALPWASFPISFAGNQETTIQLSYQVPLLLSRVGSLTLFYVFQTGAGWAGPIGQVNLELNLPYPVSDATLAGMPIDSLRATSYSVPAQRADLPAGAIWQENQVRWSWKDLEPGLEDNLALWLFPPRQWQKIQEGRARVEADPQDGQAWLSLAEVYHDVWGANIDFPDSFPTIFCLETIPPGKEALEKAAQLLPDHPAPHAGLALINLVPYLEGQNAPPEVEQTIQDEYQRAKNLANQNPSLMENKSFAWWLLVFLERSLERYQRNAATITVERLTAQAQLEAAQTEWAIMTATAATRATVTETPTTTPTFTATSPPKPTLTVTQKPAPTITTELGATAIPAGSQGESRSLSIVLIVGLSLLILVGLGFLARRKK